MRKASEVMQHSLNLDKDLFIMRAGELAAQAAKYGILITIEPVRNPVKPGYCMIVDVQPMRYRWEAILDQQKKELENVQL